MSRDPSLPGRHQCSRCGLIWHCPNKSCAPEVAPINTTLLCLTCDVAKHHHKLEQAEAALIRAQATKRRILEAREHRDKTKTKLEHLIRAEKAVYVQFTSD